MDPPVAKSRSMWGEILETYSSLVRDKVIGQRKTFLLITFSFIQLLALNHN